MRWIFLPLPRSLSRNRIPDYSFRQASRHVSTLTSNDKTIATILATDPDTSLQPTRVIGTVRTIRNQKRHSFVEIGDGSTSRPLQALLEPHQGEGQVHYDVVLRRAGAKDVLDSVLGLLWH